MRLIEKITFIIHYKKSWNLLNECFPQNELRTYLGQQDVSRLNEYHTKLLRKGKKIIGLIAWWDFNWCIFIEYLCIKESYRGMGFSYELLNYILNLGKLVIIEVDKTKDALLKFYQSRGFVPNDDYTYHPINLSFDGVNNTNLIILSYPRKVDNDELKRFYSELINPKYNQYRK